MRLIDADEFFRNYPELAIEPYINAPTVEYPFYQEAYQTGHEEGQNERPQGEWIKHIDNLFPEESTEECPFCHEEQILIGNDDNFCPNCGADMQKGGAE